MKQGKDALPKKVPPKKGASAIEKTAEPTEAWKKTLMEDIRRQPLPRRHPLRPKLFLFAFLIIICCAAVYLLVFH